LAIIERRARESVDIGYQLGKALLVELVPAPIESPGERMRQYARVLPKMIESNLRVILAVIEDHWGDALESVELLSRESELRKAGFPEGRSHEEQAAERRLGIGLRHELEQDRSAKGVSDQDRSIALLQEMVDPFCPGLKMGIFRVGHPGGSDLVLRPESVLEQGLPVDLALALPWLAGAVDHDNGWRHTGKVSSPALMA